MTEADERSLDRDQEQKRNFLEPELVKFKSPDHGTTPGPHPGDGAWLAYLGGLAPDDTTGAFLLPDELPPPDASPQEAIEAIETASRRAFLPTLKDSEGKITAEMVDQVEDSRVLTILRRAQQFRERTWRMLGFLQNVKVTDPVRGWLDGTMRVMLPQGDEHIFTFDQEPGWRANVEVRREEFVVSFLCYYTSVCMNPILSLMSSDEEVHLDTSNVTFTPIGRGRPKKIEHEHGYVHLWNRTVEQLEDRYQQVRRDNSV